MAAGVLSLANLLEQNKLMFKVLSVDGIYIEPKHLGAGGFEYWLKEPDLFQRQAAGGRVYTRDVRTGEAVSAKDLAPWGSG